MDDNDNSYNLALVIVKIPQSRTWYVFCWIADFWDAAWLKMMMKMMMMMNSFCGIVDRRKVFRLISSRDQFQRSSPSRISDTPRAEFEPAQNLSSGLVEWGCAVVITTTPRSYYLSLVITYHLSLLVIEHYLSLSHYY